MQVRDEAIGVVVDDGCIVELYVHKYITNGYIGFLEFHGCTGGPLVIFPEGSLYELDPVYMGTRYEIVLPGGAWMIWDRTDGTNTLIFPRQP